MRELSLSGITKVRPRTSFGQEIEGFCPEFQNCLNGNG
jgi:hypothetical protein